MVPLRALSLSFILLLPALGHVQAQAPDPAAPPAEVHVVDPPGDVEFTIAPRAAAQRANASQVAQGQLDHIDLLRLGFGGETDKSFEVRVQFKVLDAPQSARPMRAVSFSYGSVDWQVLTGPCPLPGGAQQQAPPNTGCLRFRDAAGGGFRAVKQIEGTRNDGMFVWTIAKDLIFNENRVPARYGERLTNISATATQYYAGGGGFAQLEPTGGAYASDRAPQSGVAPSPFVFQKGAGGRGHLLMFAPDPIRVTNGEATTIVYKVDLMSRHVEPMSVELSVEGAAPDWSVRVPPILKLEPESSVSFPVILSLPFRHDHGRTALFTVKAQAIEDPGSGGSTQLGVFWTDVPQPSGHHECDSDETCGQWFHSAQLDNPAPDQFDLVAPFKNVWFNGVAQDPAPNADDANVPAFFNDQFFCLFNPVNCKVPPQWTASWFFPMSPALLMGLDFDISREGLARLSFVPSLMDPSAKVEAQLRYCDPTKQGTGGPGPFAMISSSCYQYTVLLGSGTVTTALSPNQPVTLEVPLKMEPAADLLPYKRGANIGLSVRVFTTIPQNTIIVPPRIEFVTKASHLHMPLLEYHDPVDQEFAGLGLLKLTPQDPFEKPVNAGRTAAFRFDIMNGDEQAHHVRLEVQGVNAEWARLVGPDVVLLGPKQRANFTLAVHAPDDAVPEERAELFVVAQSQEKPEVVALSRLRATVVTHDVPDEASSLATQQDKGSPGLGGLGAFVACTVALGMALRGRRGRLAF